tara:strand:- start:255 stop:356 length:102 start_codon:yes stop_codon:yes gene_type:complete
MESWEAKSIILIMFIVLVIGSIAPLVRMVIDGI